MKLNRKQMMESEYTINTDKTAAVSTVTVWNYEMKKCPKGVKVLILSRFGCARLDVVGKDTQDAEAWAALPKRKKGKR
jgi:hypothetical protein